MTLWESILLFFVSLAAVIGGGMFLSRALGRLGPRLNIPEQFLGFLTALGADSPEISCAVVAMISGQTDVGVGVVFGSNLFNLASLFGLTAIIAGRVSASREHVLLDGGIIFWSPEWLWHWCSARPRRR
jgi:cation:H+ antiporter